MEGSICRCQHNKVDQFGCVRRQKLERHSPRLLQLRGGMIFQLFKERPLFYQVNKMQQWEVLKVFDSEAVAWVSGAAETVDYFG